MPVVLVCTVADTFTPTLSGTTGFTTWEYCQAARRAGAEPVVIAQNNPRAKPYDWPKLHLIDWPYLPKGRVGTFLMRAQRKLTGWQHFREGAFVEHLARTIEKAGLSNQPILLQNDVEPAVYLRQRFPRTFILHHFHNQQGCRPRFRKRFRGAANAVTAVSDYTARWVEEYYGLEPQSVKTVYNGVDLKRFAPAAATNGRPVINFIGRTGIEKAPDLVLQAALKVAERTRDFAVQILGCNHAGGVRMDDYQLQLKGMAEELGRLGVPVRQPGFVLPAQVPDELRRAEIHVTPSRWDEPFGLGTLEAMACGLAPVGSRTGGTPEVIGDAGLLFDRDDVAGLAAHLERLVKDEPFRRECGRRARQRAERFTWDAVWAQFTSLLPR